MPLLLAGRRHVDGPGPVGEDQAGEHGAAHHEAPRARTARTCVSSCVRYTETNPSWPYQRTSVHTSARTAPGRPGRRARSGWGPAPRAAATPHGRGVSRGRARTRSSRGQNLPTGPAVPAAGARARIAAVTTGGRRRDGRPEARRGRRARTHGAGAPSPSARWSSTSPRAAGTARCGCSRWSGPQERWSATRAWPPGCRRTSSRAARGRPRAPHARRAGGAARGAVPGGRCWAASRGRRTVDGAALVTERVVLPPEVEAEMPADPDEALSAGRPSGAAGGAARRRRCCGTATNGCAVRARDHDRDVEVAVGPGPRARACVAAVRRDPRR